MANTPTSGASAPVASNFDPKGKTFLDRLKAFINDANKTYAIVIRKDSGRTAGWQQKHHVAHMFVYNKYASTIPANVDKGERTISWSHFMDQKLLWEGGLDWSEYLRTKIGSVPQKDGNKWKEGSEPDKDKTLENVKAMLTAAGIGNNGQAMVSAGTKPCCQPCKCGAGRSKHLEDAAADLNSADLGILVGKLKSANAGDIDSYLKRFGLHRPLLNHPESPEEWHVEATE
jgi:hypothetical protein